MSAAALIIVNSPLSGIYEDIFSFPVFLQTHGAVLTLRDWINEGFMSLFFLSVGLEIRREIVGGELSTRAKAAFPLIAALGGMLIPALIYLVFTAGGLAAKGWGIPMATDIAFSLGVIALLGNRIPSGIRIFVAALAIADDIGAILVIAIFYARDIDFMFLLLALAAILILFFLRKIYILPIFVFYFFGAVLWLTLLRSGVHSAISGAALAFLLPESFVSENWENRLRRISAFIIMPLFAFANAGLRIESSEVLALLSGTVSLGIFFGLLAGKTIGIFLFSYLSSKLGFARLPEGLGWKHIFGASTLCAIGFTMSLFIAGLAFGLEDAAYSQAKFAIIAASCIAGITGYFFLRLMGSQNS
jgi:NhaA family Na+:H+ antiporter